MRLGYNTAMDFVHGDLDAPRVAFAYADDLPPFDSGWHTHTKHHVLYALYGTLHLEVAYPVQHRKQSLSRNVA